MTRTVTVKKSICPHFQTGIPPPVAAVAAVAAVAPVAALTLLQARASEMAAFNLYDVVNSHVSELLYAKAIGKEAFAGIMLAVEMYGAADKATLLPIEYERFGEREGERRFIHILLPVLARKVQIELHQHVLSHEQSNRLLAAILDNRVLREECDQDVHMRYLLDGHRSMVDFVQSQEDW